MELQGHSVPDWNYRTEQSQTLFVFFCFKIWTYQLRSLREEYLAVAKAWKQCNAIIIWSSFFGVKQSRDLNNYLDNGYRKKSSQILLNYQTIDPTIVTKE